MMDPVMCFMLFYFEFRDLINLLVEFGVEPIRNYKPNLQTQTIGLLDKGLQVGIDPQKFITRIIEIFNKIRNDKSISAQDPRTLTTKMQLDKEIISFEYVLRVCKNQTHYMDLMIPCENIQCLMDPTVLIGNSTGKKPQVQRSAAFNFCLSQEQLSNILHNAKNIANDRIYQLHARICLLEPSTDEEINCLPPGISLELNTSVLRLFISKTYITEDGSPILKPHSIDFTDGIKPRDLINTITVSWIPDYKTYSMAIYLIKIPVMNSNVVDDYQNKIKNISKKNIKEVIETMETDSDLPAIKFVISLNCPVSKVRIKLPVTSVNCNHLQCFDARTYILLNESNSKWKCPICYKLCVLGDLQIQNYLLEILNSPDLPDDVNSVEILHNGTWKAHYETKNIKQVIPCMDLDDDSMDLEVNETITVNEFMISDSEEDNTQNNIQMVNTTQTISVVSSQSQAPGQSHQVVKSSNIVRKIITIDLTSEIEEDDLGTFI